MTNKRTQGDNKHLHAVVMSPAANIKGARDIPAAPAGAGHGALLTGWLRAESSPGTAQGSALRPRSTLGAAPRPSRLAPIWG